MLDIKYIYNINKTTLPMDRKTLSDCITVAPIYGFIHCPFDSIIDTVNKINSAKEITVTKNTEEIFNTTNAVETTPEVVFKVEGIKKSADTYLDTVLSTNDIETWTDFSTYSKEFRSDILRLKELCFKKFLWNYDNIHAWFQSSNVQLNASEEYRLTNDWEQFKQDIANTDDLESFIGACSDKGKQDFVNTLIHNTKKILNKHKVEFMLHVSENDRTEKTIVLENPIINQIFVVSSKYSDCRKNFPYLHVTSISQRNFNMIGILT